ncbi:MAG: M10 family metallopeptidase C-terminal domain-containing protein [Roseibium sp.]|uniref:M10 family metallopeptidase C-terminal domain-containing protein n=1 Tax=Roseibium sp. TaxID=1936156 RepID=UPI003D9C3184
MNDRHIEFGFCACPICSGDSNGDFVAEPVDAEAIADKPVLDNDEVIDQMDTGRYWSTTIISFGFLLSGPDWDIGYETEGFSEFTDTQKAVARLTLALWDDLIAPSLVEDTEDPEYADINFGNTTSNIGYAHAYYPGTFPYAGETWYNAENDPELYDPDPGEYDRTTYLHEIGHALGLSHPGAYNAGDGDEKITYETHAEYARDTEQWTVMSYFDASYTGADWDGGAGWRYSQTPMVHDILAIQSIYGADTTTRTGNTVYGFNSNAGNDLFDFSLNRYPVLTIYDAGGMDTLNLSGFALRSIIDLTPGNYSSAGGTTSTMTFNIGIAIDTWIENAIAGSGNDTLIGNALANTMRGGDGADVINGGEGADVLFGGEGADTLIGGAGDDRAQYSDATSWVTADLTNSANNTGEAAGDTYDSIEHLYGSNYSDSLRGNSVGNWIWGAFGNDTLRGWGGNDRLDGGEGADVLIGGEGADTLIGGAGDDRAQYSDATSGVTADLANSANNTGEAAGDTYDSIEHLYGTRYSDSLRGDSGRNWIWGDSGNDHIYGREGNDRLDGGAGADVLNGGEGADTLIGGAGDDRAEYSDATSWVTADLSNSANNTGEAAGDTYDSIENLYGSNYSDSLRGNSVENSIWGGSGNDTLRGWGGNDRLEGGEGADVLIGGEGADTLIGGAGDDRAQYSDATSGVTADLAHSANNTGEAAGDTYDSIEHLYGSNYSDSLRGDSGRNWLWGAAGDDHIVGGEGNDLLSGGAGADTFEFRFGDGDDVISDFSVGEDELYFASGLSVVSSHEANVFGGSELDTILTLNSGDTIVLSDLSGISIVDLFG